MSGPAEPQPGSPPPRVRPWDSPSPRLLTGDRTANRAALYFILFMGLFVGAVVPPAPDRSPDPGLQGDLGLVSIALVLIVGALALVRYYSQRRATFLFIGTGFLGSGIMEAVHALGGAAGLGGERSPAELADLASWASAASATFLALFFVASWLTWRREHGDEDGGRARAVPIYLLAGGVALVTPGILFAFLDVPAVPRAVYPDAFLVQPGELLPTALFLLALIGYLRKGHWRYEQLDHWLVVGLLLAAMAHGGFLLFASPAEASFLAGDALATASHVTVLVGLMVSDYAAFRREVEAGRQTEEANATLAREIDIRRRAERVLQESEERLQDFLDNAHDLIQSVDPNGRFLYVNRAWRATLGYRAQEVEGLSLSEILHPSCRTRCMRQFQAVLAGEALGSLEVDFLAKDGRVVHCLGSANARFQDGVAVAARSIFRDVSEEMKARRELSAFQANLQALVENTGDAIWSVDRALRLITFNTAFSMALEARTGREPRVGDYPEESFPPSDAPWYREMFGRALRGEAFSELRDEEIAGQIRGFELFFNPIRESMGIAGVAVFGRDVTTRRRTQLALRMAKEEAERANHAKSQFLANMSHELRTPLNSVIGFTHILLKNRGGSLTQQELGFLDRISANGRHLLDLINEVLDLAKIEAGRTELELREVELGSLVRDTLAQMEGQVRDRNLVLRGEIPEQATALRTDAGKLRQVLINLLGNALKFTEHGEVVVRVITHPERAEPVAIAVRDTGIGIPHDRLQAIFEAFQQADGTTSRKYGGTGLGLTISRSLCQLMGYDLQVESEPGKGSTFTVLLSDTRAGIREAERELMEEALRSTGPSRSPARAASRARLPEEDGTGPTVLVVDDDAVARVLTGHHLADLGCRVREAASALEGIEAARAGGVDLITLDLMMPGMTGWEALRALKDDPALRRIPVVIVSALAREGERATLLGAADVLNKPVGAEELARVLQRTLDRARPPALVLVEEDPGLAVAAGGFLERAGFQVLRRAGVLEAENRLSEAVLDGFVLCLGPDAEEAAGFLARLRRRPDVGGLPVLVCGASPVNGEEADRLRPFASALVPAGERLEAELGRALARIFPISPTG